MTQMDLGESIPSHTAHAVSVSLPTWDSNVGWAKGEVRIVSKMVTGYPRFFIHKSVHKFAHAVSSAFAHKLDLQAMLFPSDVAAEACVDFLRKNAPFDTLEGLNIIHLVCDNSKLDDRAAELLSPTISGVLFQSNVFKVAKQFWQHSGSGISSRRAEFCHYLFSEGILVPKFPLKIFQRIPQTDFRGCEVASSSLALVATAASPEKRADNGPGWNFQGCRDISQQLGDAMHVLSAEKQKKIIRKRIADIVSNSMSRNQGYISQAHLDCWTACSIAEQDVYLFPTGMCAIFNIHSFLLSARGSLKSISFGFPYVDTLKVLQKFGPGCVFFGKASEEDLDHLQTLLESGERFLGLFCEFPGNPLLICPNLKRIRSLADEYNFAVVVDDTIGTFGNVNVLKYADVVVSSLTKFFSGKCNVMGGSAILNPRSPYYSVLKDTAGREYMDTWWPEDALVMERNSRDFLWRIPRMNHNAEAIAELLQDHPFVRKVYYPKHGTDRANYDDCKVPSGGYGALLSAVFHREQDAVTFYDYLDTCKGPSLGTNFTLSSPYVVLAHLAELEWATSLGVDPTLVRFSIGVEDLDDLKRIFVRALQTVEKQSTYNSAAMGI